MFRARYGITGGNLRVVQVGLKDQLPLVAVPPPDRLGLSGEELLLRLEHWLEAMYRHRKTVSQSELFDDVERFVSVYGTFSLTARRVT